MDIFLETDRVILRQFEQTDRDLIRELDSDPEVMRFLTDGVPSSDQEIERAMSAFLQCRRHFKDELGYFAAIEKESGEFMGWFHLRPLKENMKDLTKLELGYRLRRRFWGRNFATEVGKALIHKGFQRHGVTEILALTMRDNLGSRRVMEKVGMKFLRKDIFDLWPGPDKTCVWYTVKKT